MLKLIPTAYEAIILYIIRFLRIYLGNLYLQYQIENIVSENHHHQLRRTIASFSWTSIFFEAQVEVDKKRDGIERDKRHPYVRVVSVAFTAAVYDLKAMI